MGLQHLNVIFKEIKPSKKEFYYSPNLTTLPQGDLQLKGGRIVRGIIVWRVIVQGAIIQGELSGEAIDMGGKCPRGIMLGFISWG